MNGTDRHDPFADELSGLLEQAVAAVRAEAVDALRIVRVVDSARRAPVTRSVRFRRRWWPMTAYVGVAAALLIAAFAFWNHSLTPRAWAEVVSAVRQQPWILAHAKLANGDDVEIWFSAVHRVFATRNGKMVIFFDLGQETIDICPANGGTVTRLPMSQSDNTAAQAFRTMFAAFLAGDARRTISVGDTTIAFDGERELADGSIEYQFQGASSADRSPAGEQATTQMILHVNRETHLPFAWTTSWSPVPPGLPATIDYAVDYPAAGPASIYDLGVPKSATIVDRVPQGKLADVLEKVAIEVSDFDPYYAVVVHGSDSSPWWSRSMMVYRVWKSGHRWRVERGFNLPWDPNESSPPADVDQARWWFDRAEKMQFVPSQISDGKSEWHFDVKTKRAASGDHMEIESINKSRSNLVGRDPRADNRGAYGVLPELVGHPRINTWSGDWQVRLDLAATAGPPRTILIEEKPTAGGKYASWGTLLHWIEPEKSFLTMRRDEVPVGAPVTKLDTSPDQMSPQELLAATRRLRRQTVLEAIEQSPRGHWYPTQARDVNGAINQDGTSQDYVMRFYVDFDRPIPDDRFHVE